LASPRMSELHRRALGELRLALIAVDRAHDPAVPRRYVAEHRRILEALRSGATDAARALLLRHLEEAAAAVRRSPA
ncbi:MAG TPA: FCD domain-containing protein, partial [Gemmatimonadota bacterium]|nr:FCD domain-containing protein [Gemmatimonadota bacterium]